MIDQSTDQAAKARRALELEQTTSHGCGFRAALAEARRVLDEEIDRRPLADRAALRRLVAALDDIKERA